MDAEELEAFRKHIEIERGLASWPTYGCQLRGYLRFLGGRGRSVLEATRDDVVAYLEEKKAAGLDEMDARSEALEFLKSKGAGFFTKRDIALKGN